MPTCAAGSPAGPKLAGAQLAPEDHALSAGCAGGTGSQGSTCADLKGCSLLVGCSVVVT